MCYRRPRGGRYKAAFNLLKGRFIVQIFVYSDESGVLDKAHNPYYVFGGLIFLSKTERDNCARMFLHAENTVKNCVKMEKSAEAKASQLSNKYKGKLFRALNNRCRFGVIIDENRIHEEIFNDKKSKQRYLDYAYKIAVKRCFENLILRGKITPMDVESISFFVDEHTTATNGRYELREALEQEFKSGTYNYKWTKRFPPLFPAVSSVNLSYCNSSKTTLIRAADIVANRIFHNAHKDPNYQCFQNDLHVIRLP